MTSLLATGPEPAGLAPAHDRGAAGWRSVGVYGLTMVAEGFDNYSVGFAAPLVVKGWGISPALLGTLFALNVAASALGTAAIGPLAERFGRRRTLVAAIVAFGLATLATARATGPWGLMAARTLSSLALGASVPLAIALASEATVAARRAAVARQWRVRSASA